MSKQMDYQAPVGNLADWYAEQYKKAVDLNIEGNRAFQKSLMQFPVASKEGYLISGRQRMSKFIELKLRNPLSQNGYNCAGLGAVLGPKQDQEPTRSYFAMVYWPANSKLVDVFSSSRIPAYISVSPTYTSRDGEFRRRFIPLEGFLSSYEKYARELSVFEESVLTLMASADLSFYVEMFGELVDQQVSKVIIDTRIHLMALSVALMLDLWDNKKTLLDLHVLPAYSSLITSIAMRIPELLQISRDFPNNIRKLFVRNSDNFLTVSCGIKVIPMYSKEVDNPFDLNLSAWRELEVAKAVGDLVVSYVSPAFAIFNQWTYIERAQIGLFENLAMHERYLRSEEMSSSIKSLRNSRCAISLDCELPEDSKALDPALRTYHTEELSAQLYESLEYAQSHLVVSNVAIVHTVEDVGRTLMSWPIYIKREPSLIKSCTDLFGQIDNFARLLFDYVYGAHCLQEKLGVIHGDLHANNLTVYRWGIAERNKEPLYLNPTVLFETGPRGEADSYVFPAAGISGCLIDYSRAILGPAFRPRLEAGRTAQYATNFYRDQVNRVMRLLHRYAPEYVSANQDAIKGVAYADFGSVFQALCAVDYISIGQSANLAIESARKSDPDDKRPCATAEGAADLAKQVEKAGRAFLIKSLYEIVERATSKTGGGRCLFDCGQCDCEICECDASCSCKATCNCEKFYQDFPVAAAAIYADKKVTNGGKESGISAGLSVIQSVFEDYKFSKWLARQSQPIQLVDAYNFNNMLHSSTDYSSWPQWAQLKEIEKHLGDLKMTDLFEYGTEKFVSTLSGRNTTFEVVAAQSRADAEKVDGQPVAAASSWIDE